MSGMAYLCLWECNSLSWDQVEATVSDWNDLKQGQKGLEHIKHLKKHLNTKSGDFSILHLNTFLSGNSMTLMESQDLQMTVPDVSPYKAGSTSMTIG